jgi:hypothetical protein
MPSSSSAKSSVLFGHQPFLLYFWARGFSEFSSQIGAVAMGWQVYALTSSAFDLGMVGLLQFMPTRLSFLSRGTPRIATTAGLWYRFARLRKA